jgi:tRNA (cytidine/uridine-2'-O-)-methyltransferase
MFHIVLFQPEIPPNTGNIIRLCANTGARLHLIRPLGFRLDDRELRRAGLDYHECAEIQVHEDWNACQAAMPGRRAFAFSTQGAQIYDSVAYAPEDVLVFGPETRGLPTEVLAGFAPGQRLRLPMRPGNRSLNLSNAVAVVVYEGWRQVGFPGGE